MNNSNGFQTGGIVLLAMSIVFCGIAVALVLPLIDRANQPLIVTQPTVASSPVALVPVSQEYSEFYPSGAIRQSETRPNVGPDLPPPRMQSRTEQASYAQPVSEPIVVASSQYQPPRQPPAVTSTQFYSRQSTGNSQPPASPGPSQQSAWPEPSTVAAAPVAEQSKSDTETRPQHQPVQPTQSTRYVVVDNTPIDAEGNQSPKFAPGQIPTGSVYAPVTVNLDTSMFSEQIRSLERRLDEAAQATQPVVQQSTVKQPVVQPIIHQPIIQPVIQQPVAQPERPRRERIARNDVRRRDDRNEDLSRIGDGLKELVTSFKELQQQTNESLREVSRQAERREVAAEVIEAYRTALLRDAREARSVTLPEPTRIASRPVQSDVQRYVSKRVLAQKAGATTESSPVPAPIDVPAKTEPQTTEEIPVLRLPESETISAPRVRTVVQPAMTAKILQPQEEVPVAPLKMSTPEPVETVPEIEGFLPIPLPLDTDSTSLSPVPEMPRQVAPVAYANTYRFKMSVSESGEAKVVPSDDVCAECGKAHGPNEPHAKRVPQIVQTAAAVAPATVENKKKQTPPKPNLRRDKRNAGRGMNRKIGSVHKKAETKEKSSRGFLKLKLPTMTSGDDEPGVLHRMSATIKQLGRSVQ